MLETRTQHHHQLQTTFTPIKVTIVPHKGALLGWRAKKISISSTLAKKNTFEKLIEVHYNIYVICYIVVYHASNFHISWQQVASLACRFRGYYNIRTPGVHVAEKTNNMKLGAILERTMLPPPFFIRNQLEIYNSLLDALHDQIIDSKSTPILP
jgi:hypothetical protein